MSDAEGHASEYRQVCFSHHGRECVECGEGEGVIAHHLDGDRTNSTPENLRPFCRSCHRSVHNGGEGFEEWTSQLPESAKIDNSVQGIRPFEYDVLRVFAEGRANPLLARSKTGLSQTRVKTAITRLGKKGYLVRVVRGLYEITDRGREACDYTGDGTGGHVDAAAVASALDDLETAMERGDQQAALQALQRARKELNDD